MMFIDTMKVILGLTKAQNEVHRCYEDRFSFNRSAN